jgi:hypothetical protein
MQISEKGRFKTGIMDNCRAPIHAIGRGDFLGAFDYFLPDIGRRECIFHSLYRYTGYALNGRWDFDILWQTCHIGLYGQGFWKNGYGGAGLCPTDFKEVSFLRIGTGGLAIKR